MIKELTFSLGTRVLLWRLVEDALRLMALCREAGIPCDDLQEAPAKRQRERAAERLLLCHAFGHHVLLSHTAQGAPMVVGSDVNVSISHTQGLVVLAIDPERIIGVDAEQTDRHQVLRVRDKFLNTKEKRFIAPDDLAAHIIAWTAKEAIIKAERNSALDWTEGICLEPFTVNDDLITFAARCGRNCYRLSSTCIEGHYLTLAVATIG